MIIYQVTVIIQADVELDWLEWMTRVHIPDVLGTGCFSECRICKDLDTAEGRPAYVFQYECPSREEYAHYRTDFAPALQKDHSERFAGHFHASRRLLEQVRRSIPGKTEN
jgi:hypothetical protein